MDYELLQKLYNIDSFVGYTEDEIREMSDGFDTIPAALLDFWKKCGNTEVLFANSNDHWIDLNFRRNSRWIKEVSKDYYYLLDENQHCYQAAIRRTDMSLADPPVYIVEPVQGDGVKEIGRAEESVSAFLMGMLLYEAALSAGPFQYFYEDIIWYSEDDIAKLEKLLQKYPYHIYNWYSERIDIYTLDGEALLFVMQSDEPNGTYSAKTEEALHRMTERIGEIGES